MRGVINYELFQYIELKGRVSVDDIVDKFSMSKRSAATALSRFTSYEKDGITKHYLVYEKGEKSRRRRFTKTEIKERDSRYGPKRRVRAQGTYRIGPDWWGELRGAMKGLSV